MNSFQILVTVLTVVYLAFCIWVGNKTKSDIKNANDYFLAGKEVTFWFLFFTCWATFSGAGNFVGYTGRAAMHGISAFWVFIGEVVLGYNAFAYFLGQLYHTSSWLHHN